MKILAIIDNPDNHTALQAILSDKLPEARLLTALNGPHGLKLAQSEDPDVILLKNVIPGMDGYDVCRRLKENVCLQAIPVIFLMDIKTDYDRCLKALDVGAEGFLAEPFDALELIVQIRTMVKIKAAIIMQRENNDRLAVMVAERTLALQKSRAAAFNLLEDVKAENTLRKNSELALQHEKHLINSIIDCIPGAFYVLDDRGRYRHWNAYQRDEIIGLPEDQVAGLDAVNAIHPDDRARVQSKIVNVLKNGAVEVVEGRVLLHGGPTFRWLLLTGRQLIIDGRPCLVGVGVDITENKRLEAEKVQQLDELRRWQVVTLERENRVNELKREVNALTKRLGETPKYASVAAK